MNTFLVVFGAFMITFIGVGIGHAFGLYLVPMTEYLNIGRETFGLAFAFLVMASIFALAYLLIIMPIVYLIMFVWDLLLK